jgi:osmotically inducible protein OsmC
MATKQARVSWKGDLENGTGMIEQVGSGAVGPLAVSWAARTGDEGGMTSPEELIAAAHAACFSMAFSARLAKAGTPPDRLEVSAAVTFVPGTGITTSEIDVTGVVPGISEEDFVSLAEDAKDNCPVSSALKGNVEMSVTARLAS